MGVSTQIVKCKDCAEKDPLGGGEFEVSLEWKTNKEAIKIIEETKCPICGSEYWYFTDSFEN